MAESAPRHYPLVSVVTFVLFLASLLSTSIFTVSASATRHQTRPQPDKFSTSDTQYQYYNYGHRPSTSILPLKTINFHQDHHGDQPAVDGKKRNEFERLNKMKGQKPLTRVGLYNAVVHATRQSSDIVVMGATSWNQ
eukprot:CCRYP_005096-RA/>CCRYP_005096-RA protein AED:0.05 eAED:0.05 QI:63/1/1/1/0/0/2/469/136